MKKQMPAHENTRRYTHYTPSADLVHCPAGSDLPAVVVLRRRVGSRLVGAAARWGRVPRDVHKKTWVYENTRRGIFF